MSKLNNQIGPGATAQTLAGVTSPRNRLWRLLFIVAVLAAFVYLGRHLFDQLDRLAQAAPLPVMMLFALLIAARLLRGLQLQILLARLERRVGVMEMFFLSVLVSYSNLIIPKAGLAAPALYLKRRHALSFAHFGLASLMLATLHTTAVAALGLVVLASAGGAALRGTNLATGGALIVILCIGLTVIVLRPRVPKLWSGKIADLLRRSVDGWRLLGNAPRRSAAIFGLSLAVILAQSLKLACAFWAIDADVAFAGVLMATVLSELALLISVTPGALGFREAAVAASAAWLGCSPETALAAAVLDRLVMTAAIVLLAQAGTWRLSAVAAGGPSKSQPPSVDG
jgi:uncharacterized membrane protein YbhN (UPF0104 family)